MNLTIERPTLVDVQDFQQRQPPSESGKPLFGESGPTFGDLLDIINPLQHLPLVGTIYRALTGDELSDGARMAGGALYGGPIGLIAAMANLGVREATGRDLGELAMAAVTGDEAPAPVAAKDAAPTEVAALAPAATAAAEPAAATTMPQLSPEAFDALLRSVNQPVQAETHATRPTTRRAAWRQPNPLSSAPVAMPPAVRAAARAGLPQVIPAPLDALAGGPAAIPAMAPGARQASLELHDALQLYAQQRGLAPLR
jgi:hypothetical protein